MTRFGVILLLLIISLSFVVHSEAATNNRTTRSNNKVQLTTRFRTMVSDKITHQQLMKLIQSLADLIIFNYPIAKLKLELAERLLTVLKPIQSVQLMGAFECYQNNLGESDAKILFSKTGEIISTFISPGFYDIYGQLQTFRIVGFTSEEKRSFVMTKLNLIFSEAMFRSIFTSLSQQLTILQLSIHRNCGGRIVKFEKYFRMEPL